MSSAWFGLSLVFIKADIVAATKRPFKPSRFNTAGRTQTLQPNRLSNLITFTAFRLRLYSARTIARVRQLLPHQERPVCHLILILSVPNAVAQW